MSGIAFAVIIIVGIVFATMFTWAWGARDATIVKCLNTLDRLEQKVKDENRW